MKNVSGWLPPKMRCLTMMVWESSAITSPESAPRPCSRPSTRAAGREDFVASVTNTRPIIFCKGRIVLRNKYFDVLVFTLRRRERMPIQSICKTNWKSEPEVNLTIITRLCKNQKTCYRCAHKDEKEAGGEACLPEETSYKFEASHDPVTGQPVVKCCTYQNGVHNVV